MYQLDDATITALRTGPILDVGMEIFQGGGKVMLACTYLDPKINLDIGNGSIEVARKADFARQFSAKIIDPDGDWVPKAEQSYFDPLLRPWVRIFWTVNDFKIPVGTFCLEKCIAKEDSGGVTMDISGNDIAVLVQQNPWVEPFDIGGTGTLYHSEIQKIITDRCANFTPTFRFEESTKECPAATFDDSADPWAEAKKLAEADAKELFVDQTGAFVLRAVPDPKKLSSVWYYDESKFSMRLDGMERSIDTANVYNGVRVKASASWLLFPIMGLAWDTDPASPTYYKGPMGMKAKEIENALVGDQEGADAAAAAELLNCLGVMEEVSFEAVINPAHEPGDVVTVGSDILGMQENVLLETFTLQFDVTQSMPGTCRRQRRA